MAERARFEIYPELLSCGTYTKPTGRYCWQFRIDGVVICSAARRFVNRDSANDDIHAFMRAIDAAECGIHPDIIDLDEAP